MIFKALIVAASMLPWGNPTPSANIQNTVELQIEVPVMAQNFSISQSILTELMEVHVPEVYGTSVEEAWQAYNSGALVVTELSPNKLYQLEMDGILEIVVTEGGY